LSELDEEWRQESFGLKLPTFEADNPVFPWVVLGGIMLAVPLVIIIGGLVRPARRKPAAGSSG
jgi:hypothetical protein